jgi:hypothetical protein
MTLSIIKKYINLIFNKQNKNKPKSKITVEFFEKENDPRYVKIQVHNNFDTIGLKQELESLFTEELYKVTVKIWGKGQSNENIIFHESIDYIVHKGNIEDLVKDANEIVEKKKAYYSLDSVRFTELTVFKLSIIMNRKEL